jgi:hypothetical protein
MESNIHVLENNIYITDNSEIKEGDWFLNTLNNQVNKCDDLIYEKNVNLSSWCKKIILTTNKLLIRDGIQSISDEFLQWFMAHSSCERVEVSYGLLKPFKSTEKGYMIHLPDNGGVVEPKKYPSIQCDEACYYHCTKGGTQSPDCEKEKPKQYPISGYAPGFYSCTCVTCKEEFQGHKRATQCEHCAIKMTQEELKNICPKCRTTDFDNCHSIKCPMRKEEHKQETIEDAAEQFANDCTLVSEAAAYEAFIAGANSDAARDYWFKIFKEQFIVSSSGK